MIYNKKVKQNKDSIKIPFLLAHKNSKDLSIESLRSLRTSLQISLLGIENNVISITSSSPGVGKSFISSNLATLMSDLGKKILLIDSDMRLGILYQCLGKRKATGLATFLQNEADINQIIQSVTPGKLDFISTGNYPHNPSELLSDKKFSDLISTLKNQYDLIIIDTPPILAVTDPLVILQQSAINIMVLGVGKDQIKEVIHAKRTLENAGIELTGVVFNTLSQKNLGLAYGNYNYHYAYEK